MELKEIKKMNPRKYWLGEIVKIHEIADYAFIEYKEKNFPPHGNGEETGKHCFSVFTNGQSIGLSCTTIDSAMATAIANKYDGNNSQAAHFFMKMIGS